MTDVFIKGEIETQRQTHIKGSAQEEKGRMPCEVEGRGGNYFAISQGISGVARNWKKQGRIVCLEVSEGLWSRQYLDFRLLSSRTVRCKFLLLCCSFVILCYGSPSQRIHHWQILSLFTLPLQRRNACSSWPPTETLESKWVKWGG